MKKILLIAAAVIMAVSANAQIAKGQNAKKAQAQQKVLPAATQKHYQVAGMKSFEALNCEMAKMGKKFNMSQSAKSMVAAPKMKAAAAKFKAAAVQAEYNAKGIQVSNDSVMQWVMKSSVVNDTLLLSNVLPNVFGFEEGVLVEYKLIDNQIVIEPQVIASNNDGTMFVYIESATTNNGVITLKLNDDGTIGDKYSILYAAYKDTVRTDENYLGWYGCYAKNITYRVPGQKAVAPQVEYQPNNLVLFAGLGISGYQYNDNLALIGAYAPLGFINNTQDDATGWDWSVLQTTGSEENEQTVAIRGTEKDFTFNTVANAVYENLALVGINETEKSDSVKWGFGKTLTTEGAVRFAALHAYAGGYGSQFGFSDGTFATMTTQDPDGDLTFYTNWGTPDKASNEMSKVYVYQGKPSSPLYFEGVTVPLVGFEAKEGFNLHIAIRKCARDSKTGKIKLGDIVAEADATSENINAEYQGQSGLTAIEFNSLYVEDEFGLSEEIDYLFMDEEFLIEIDGWNNGTFTGVLGSQDITPANGLTTTWFEMAGEPGTTYAYTSWKPSLLVGLIEPAYGYLYTTDETRLVLATEGGEATIHVNPMLTSKDDQGKPTYRLFVEEILVDGEVAEELPEWLTFQIANEDYNEESEHYGEYDLIVKAAAMPAEVAGREITITFCQEGALLPVTVIQGTPVGIKNVIATNSQMNNGKVYDLSGRQVAAGKKGLVILNGKKYIVK